jgi:hypothetical protein
VALAERTPVVCDPVRAFVPDQPPEAEQDVALEEVQVSVELVLLAMVVGAAEMPTEGGFALIDTVADWAAVPPVPVQVNVKVVLAVSAPEDCEPLTALVPDHPPEPEHEVAFFAVQVSVVEAPEVTVLGLAVSVTEGAEAETVTVADCVAEPPVPVQVNSYSVVLERAAVDQVPLVPTTPCQPPEAVQAVAFVELQRRLDVPPAATVVGEADMMIVGTGEVTTTSADCEADPPRPEQVSV